MNEVWKDIEGYEESYQISNLGRIKSLPKKGNYKGENIRKQHLSHKGYLICSLVKNRNVKTFFVHRLVAQAFIPNPNDLPQVNHMDGNKLNNTVDNLEWVTNKENYEHSVKTGIRDINKSINAMTKAKEKKINQYTLEGKYIKTWNSAKEIELFYNKKTHISDVCKGKRNKTIGYIWKYVE